MDREMALIKQEDLSLTVLEDGPGKQELKSQFIELRA
jgi:hypothetical protein